MNTPMNAPRFSATEALRFGWAAVKREPKALVGSYAILLAVSFLLNWLQGAVGRSGPALAAAGLLNALVNIVLAIGWLRMLLAAADGRPLRFSAFKEASARDVGRYIGFALLSALVVLAGLILIVVPGIVAALALSMGIFIVVDRALPVTASMRESARITRGERLRLLGFFVLAALVNLLGFLLLGVGTLVTAPLTGVALARVYRLLSASAPAAPDAPGASSSDASGAPLPAEPMPHELVKEA